MALRLKIQILKEGKIFVAHAPELDVSIGGKTMNEAKKNLREAVELFIETAKEQGTLEDILEEAGFHKEGGSSL